MGQRFVYKVDLKEMKILEKKIEKCPLISEKARFFVMKSFDIESVKLSYKFNVWATTSGPTKKLLDAFNSCENVYLIFSVNESGCF